MKQLPKCYMSEYEALRAYDWIKENTNYPMEWSYYSSDVVGLAIDSYGDITAFTEPSKIGQGIKHGVATWHTIDKKTFLSTLDIPLGVLDGSSS